MLKKHAEDEVSQVRKLVEAVLKGEKPEGGSEEDKADGGSEEDKADGGSEEDEQEGGSKEDKSDSGSEEDDSEQLPEDHPFVWLERVLRHSSISAETLVKAFEGSSTQVFNLGHGDSFLTIRPNGAWSLATISSNEALNGDGIKALEELFSQHKINYELTKSFISAELGELNEISVILSNAYIQFSNPAAFVFKNKGKRVEVILSDKNANKDQILANVVNSISREKIKNLKGASAIAQAIKELFADEAKTAPSSGGGGSKEDKSGNESEEDDSEQLPKDHPFVWLAGVLPKSIRFSAEELAQAFEDQKQVNFNLGNQQTLTIHTNGRWRVTDYFRGQGRVNLESQLNDIKQTFDAVTQLVKSSTESGEDADDILKKWNEGQLILPNAGSGRKVVWRVLNKGGQPRHFRLLENPTAEQAVEWYHFEQGNWAVAPVSVVFRWVQSQWKNAKDKLNNLGNRSSRRDYDDVPAIDEAALLALRAAASKGVGTETGDDGGSEPSPPENETSNGEHYGVFSAENSDKVAEVFAEGGEILLENGEQKLVVQEGGSWKVINSDETESAFYGNDKDAFIKQVEESQTKLLRLQEIFQSAEISEADKSLINSGVFWGQIGRLDWSFKNKQRDTYVIRLDDFCDSNVTPDLEVAQNGLIWSKNGRTSMQDGVDSLFKSLTG